MIWTKIEPLISYQYIYLEIYFLFYFWERYKLEIWWYKFENKYTYLFYILFLFEHDGSPQIMLNECLYGLPWLQRKSNCHSHHSSNKERSRLNIQTPEDRDWEREREPAFVLRNGHFHLSILSSSSLNKQNFQVFEILRSAQEAEYSNAVRDLNSRIGRVLEENWILLQWTLGFWNSIS